MFGSLKRNIFIQKYTAFLLAGLPSFIIAIFINWLLVDFFEFNKLFSYAFVQLFQVVLNFFMCKFFVFKNKSKLNVINQFFQFITGIVFFRFLDWIIYSLIISNFDIYFIFVQVSNTIIFSLFKFLYTKNILEVK